MSRGQVAYFDQRADRAALASQTTPNSDIPFIKYKKVSRLRRNYPQNALFPTPYIGGKVPELTGAHQNSQELTRNYPRNYPRNSPLESRLFYGFVVGACVAGAALVGCTRNGPERGRSGDPQYGWLEKPMCK